MEFEDLQVIWTDQDKTPLFAFDHDAMHRKIQSRLRNSQRIASTQEWGLGLIFLAVALILVLMGQTTWIGFLPVAAALFVVGRVWVRRQRRKASLKGFDASMLGTLNAAIANESHLYQEGRTLLFWMLLPMATTSLMNMAASPTSKPLWQWLFVIGSFVLGYLVALRAPRKHARQRTSLIEVRTVLLNAKELQ